MLKTYAEIKDMIVVNIVVVADEDICYFPEFVLIPVDENNTHLYGIGDGYDGKNWSKAVQAE